MSDSSFQNLADRLHDALPQTQCTKCGFNGCRPYAEAMAAGTAEHNRCPPGGEAGIARLGAILGRAVIPLNPDNGVERRRPVAVIDPTLCIGCTLCIKACPVDAIVGAPKQLHAVLADYCTGCDLCVPPCPMDCIYMVPVTEETGWAAWPQSLADLARSRYEERNARLQREAEEQRQRLEAKANAKAEEVAALVAETSEEAAEKARKQAVIAAALARLKKTPPAL